MNNNNNNTVGGSRKQRATPTTVQPWLVATGDWRSDVRGRTSQRCRSTVLYTILPTTTILLPINRAARARPCSRRRPAAVSLRSSIPSARTLDPLQMQRRRRRRLSRALREGETLQNSAAKPWIIKDPFQSCTKCKQILQSAVVNFYTYCVNLISLCVDARLLSEHSSPP